ncbi:MATH and LRR domain-containing protein PFE0570w-like [Achroia grisella]|uniref:MATH and LRR domain-containing protein PFE0570w-like n=1 Tax=Achroia grisella TaxID=688607 RepID=UPI0027D2612C|nr:MATH and LRR domain-containing protein PFE0570w-like [Achroia grisella]XP_059059805.1 MATH and LRR domain-containing protein PFE0570w-like [Achroia grisella]XP_059059806.1 MATH and LRR domain-containing protein PFE0570w-like [Achroia grisella]
MKKSEVTRMDSSSDDAFMWTKDSGVEESSDGSIILHQFTKIPKHPDANKTIQIHTLPYNLDNVFEIKSVPCAMDSDDIDTTNNIGIKTEPGSKTDSKKKKKKNKNAPHTVVHPDDESYLSTRVKEELASQSENEKLPKSSEKSKKKKGDPKIDNSSKKKNGNPHVDLKQNSTKRKNNKPDSDSEEILWKKRIKLESGSDTDIYKQNRKRQNDVEMSQISSIHSDYNSADDSFLDAKVKQENNKSQKVNKQTKSKCNSDDIQNERENLSKTSKKSKRKKNNSDMDATVNIKGNEVPFGKNNKKNNKKNKKSNNKRDKIEKMNVDVNDTEIYDINNSKTTPGSSFMNSFEITKAENENTLALHSDESSTDDFHMDIASCKPTIIKLKENNISKVVSRNISQQNLTIAERFTFEDDNNRSNNEAHQSTRNSTITSLTTFKNCFKEAANIKPIVGVNQNSSAVSIDDEVWLLNWPHEVDGKTLTENELSLDSECKVKVRSDAYQALIDEDINRITMSSPEPNNVINNLALSGTVNFRKRIPKRRMQDDISPTEIQTNAIPLPETKCRHPLFGADYKKSLDLPNAVAQRLKENERSSLHGKRRKKNKPKMHVKGEKINNDTNEPEKVVTKKPKKRRHSDIKSKKTKPVSNKPVSADTWKSGKSIEEMLFNF